MDSQVPSKGEVLVELFELQKRLIPLLFTSDALKNRGDLIQALESFEQLIKTTYQVLSLEEINNKYYPESPREISLTANQLINALNTEADVLDALGQPERAERRRKEASKLAETYLAEADVAEKERQRAGSLIGQGRFNEALVALTAARDIFRTNHDALNMANVTTTIAGILEWLGDYDRALVEVKAALVLVDTFLSAPTDKDRGARTSLFEENLKKIEQATRIKVIRLELAQIQARTNRYLGHWDESERQFREIITQMPEDIWPVIEAQFAKIANGRGQYQDSLAIINRLEPKFRGLMRTKLGVLLIYKGEALLRLGKPEEALTNLNNAVDDLERYRDLDALWKAQWLRASALAALGRLDEALEGYKQSIDTIVNLRKAPLGYRLDSTYLRDKLPVFEAAINLACDNGKGELCCELIEAAKARTLSAILGIPAGTQTKAGQTLDQRFDELTRQLDALEYAGYQDGWTDETRKRKISLQAQRVECLEQIRFSDPRWRSLSEPLAFDLQMIVALLNKRQQAALTLFYRPTYVISVLVYDGLCQAAKMPLSDETRHALKLYEENLQAAQPDIARFDPSLNLGLLAEQLITAQYLRQAIQAESLIIIPHGPLHLLPWAGLTFQGKRLFEYCPVGILPNLSCIPSLVDRVAGIPKAALIGAPDYHRLRMKPLLSAEVEIQDIENIYLMHRGLIERKFIGKEATEVNFWRLAKSPDSAGNIMHISSHGTFDAYEPMSSGLLFTDAKVDAAEIAHAGLYYDEVVLSACSTGYRPTEVQGVTLSGDDVLGLPGAILEAGVHSVLVSIPPAREDATQRLMTLYHESRAGGGSPLPALQEAQKTMLDEKQYSPCLWVGFTMYGCG